MLALEQELEEEFQTSTAKGHLDQAFEYAYGGEPEKALEECEILMIIYSPYCIAGIALLINVALSLQLEPPDESEDMGYTFF